MAAVRYLCTVAVLLAAVFGCRAQTGCKAPLSLNFYNAHRSCSCRATSSCPKNSTDLEAAAPAGSRLICPAALVGKTRINLHGSVSCPEGCGNSLQDVQIWQADVNGRYSPRSNCSTLINLGSQTSFDAAAPLPGVVTEGPQAKIPAKHVGFVHVLVRTSADGFVSEQFRYPGFTYASDEVVASKEMTCRNVENGSVAGPALVDALRTGNVDCSFVVNFSCRRGDIQRYAREVKRMVALPESVSSEHTGGSPTLPGCPKVKDVADYYGRASLAIIVEAVDRKQLRCVNRTLPKVAHDSFALQSTYVAHVKDVLKDNNKGKYGNLSGILEVHKGRLVQIQYGGDVTCCSELVAGERYLVIGIPLPLVGKSNRAADVGGEDVYRVWADVVFSSAHALHHMLRSS